MSQLRKIRYRLFAWRNFPKLIPSNEPIDVVIPIIAKDLQILPLCLEGVRKCVMHPIEQIYIVAPEQPEIHDFCRQHGVRFVEESSVLGFPPQQLELITDQGVNRSGWLYQQFLKMSGTVGNCRRYLCIDADHVLIRPHTFFTEAGKTVFYMSYEEHQPYYDLIHRMLPQLQLSPLSYVAHKMLFDKEQLRALKRAISANNGGKHWQQVILDQIDRSTHSGFSEFETYGNFVEKKELRPWLQKRLPYTRLTDYDSLRRRYSGSRWSLTFPEYMQAK